MSNSKSNISQLITQLKQYKRKYYLNKLTRGLIFFGAVLVSVYLLFSSIEYTAHLNSLWRGLLFFSFILLFVSILIYWVIDPLIKISSNRRQISDEEAARQIGAYFPEVKDKLLNVLQLQHSSHANNALISASIMQKTKQLSVVSFPLAIDLKQNTRFLQYLLYPAFLSLSLFLFIPQLFTDSTKRIINFRKEYKPEAPFTFNLQNKELIAFRNEDFQIDMLVKGNSLPDKVYLNSADRKIRMTPSQNGAFQYTIQNIQKNTSFSIEAAGFQTGTYHIEVVDRPNLKNFSVFLDYPAYLNKKDVRLNNTGNLQVPEGTKVSWKFGMLATDSAWISFPEEDTIYSLNEDVEGSYSFSRQVRESGGYQLNLKNAYSENKQEISYYLDVIPDRYPQITLEQFQDTTLYRFLVLGGNLSDDYGLSALALYYKFEQGGQDDQKAAYQRVNIKLASQQNNQSYYYQWPIDSFNLNPGDKIHYFLRVWDNDAVNGYKSSKTSSYTFQIPDKQTIRESLAQSSEQTQAQMSKTRQKAEDLHQQIKEAEQKLKGKKELSWQDEQMLQDLLEQREEIEKALQELKEQNKTDNLKRDEFTEQSERVQDQIEQLQNLVDELLDDETRKLYEELQKLLQEKTDMEKIQENLSKLGDKEQNLEEELERTLELFKRMKFDMKLEELQQQLTENANQQENLSQKTDDKNQSTDSLSKEQQQLNEDFNKFQEELKELEELNQDLKNPSPMQDLSDEQQSIEQEQQKAKDALDQGKRNKAQQSQQKSTEQMKQMANKLQQMQQSMQMEMLQENMDNLRNILDNLITLSFDQESVMKNFREVKQNDPRFIDLSQEQLKLKDDAKIIEDSLLSLAERVFQIQSFVTREVKEMNQHMDESMESLRERQQYKAISKQQFAMTSMNNLALLLNDVLSQMQQQMAAAMGNPQNKQGNTRQNMNLSELQKQLNQQIQDLKQSGTSGRELSEELARLAAQQEKIRQALQKMEQMQQQKGKEGSGDNLSEQMEETESDLVNKRLTSEMIERQKEIMTRLLEVEKSMREQDLDDERKGETAKDDYEQQVTKSFEKYIQTKKQEIELLQTVPVKLNPYYKNEANEYFKRIN